MKNLTICMMVLMMLFGCTRQGNQEEADLVLMNGLILTMDPSLPQAEALAVKDGIIICVGDKAEIESFIGENTQVIDLQGQLAVPGLIDCHGHYMSLGESLMGIGLKPAKTWDDIVALVAETAKQVESGAWIVGRGWHQDKWIMPPDPNIQGLPIHLELSQVSPNNPVMLIHVSGHGVFVNARALEEAGITQDTPDPSGGKIVRDNQGHPTGMLRETAQDVVRETLAQYLAKRPPEIIEAEMRKQVEMAGKQALSNGITCFHDMGESFSTIDLLKIMAGEGNLPVRLYVAIQEPSVVMQHKLADYRMVGYGNGYLTVRTIGEKVLDGALGTHGGWLLEPYADLPESSGYNVTPVADIRHSAELAVQHGFQMAIQGIGDRAVRELLDMYSEAFAQNPDEKDYRWRIEHCQVIHPQDLPRFVDMGVIASVRGVFATSDGPWVKKRLGEERAKERGYLYQTLFQSGAVVINGTDPPVEDINPIANFYCSVTRIMANGAVFFPDQRLSREQALASYTTNAAYASFEEERKGTLSLGKLADITVFSQDIMSVPEEKILKTKVVYTIIGGIVKYQD